MNRYLTIYIPKTAVPAPVSRFLRTQAGLTKSRSARRSSVPVVSEKTDNSAG